MSVNRNKNIRNLMGLWFFSILFSAATTDAAGNEKAIFSGSGYGIEELSVSHRQSFCEQNDAMLKDPSINIEHALNGAHLNVLISRESEHGLINYDEETGIDPINPGVYVEILDYVAEHANITWRNSFGITAEDRGNVTFIELLQWGTETYDIYIGDWARSSERRNLGMYDYMM